MVPANENIICPVRKIYLNGVMRARSRLIRNENSMIRGVSNPNTTCTAATRELSSGTIPAMPNALLNIELNGIKAPTITLDPALSIKNPRIVLKVPEITSDTLFFIAIRPIIATRPNTTVGWLKKSTKNFIIPFFSFFLLLSYFI